MIAIGLSLALLCCFAASAQQRGVPSSQPASRPEDEKSLKIVGAPVDPKTYIIGAEDNLMIEVWKEPDLSRAVLVRLDGKISLPLLGEMQAGGLTPETLAANLATAWSKYVTAPNVMVSVSAVNSKKYFVIGQVTRPGSFSLVVPTTILQALAIAGGFQDYANSKNITILRGAKRFRFNYQDFIRGKNESQNILLENGDQIIVP
jgi:polysaccharide export outer membrane protein